MSLRAIIKAALQGIARFVVVTTEVIVGGVRTLVTALVPARNTAALDEAEEVLSEGRPEAPDANDGDTLREVRRNARRSEPERIRMAAREMSEDRSVPAGWLDPADRHEGEVLAWTRSLGALQLGMLAKARDEDIVMHLAGVKTLRMPLLPNEQSLVDERKAAAEPLSRLEWTRELMRLRSEDGHNDIGEEELDEMMAQAEELSEQRASLADLPAPRSSAPDRVIDDREEG